MIPDHPTSIILKTSLICIRGNDSTTGRLHLNWVDGSPISTHLPKSPWAKATGLWAASHKWGFQNWRYSIWAPFTGRCFSSTRDLHRAREGIAVQPSQKTRNFVNLCTSASCICHRAINWLKSVLSSERLNIAMIYCQNFEFSFLTWKVKIFHYFTDYTDGTTASRDFKCIIVLKKSASSAKSVDIVFQKVQRAKLSAFTVLCKHSLTITKIKNISENPPNQTLFAF